MVVGCAALSDRRAGHPARLQPRLGGLRRTAPQQRACHRRGARNPGALYLCVCAARIRPPLAPDHRPLAEPAAAHAGAIAARRCRRHRHRLEIRFSGERQAHLESCGLRDSGSAIGRERGVDFAGTVGIDGMVRRAPVLLRNSRPARRATLRYRHLLSGRACNFAAAARSLARRPARDPAASAAKRFAADLLLLHDLGSAHHAGFAPGALHVRAGSGASWALSRVFHADATGALHRAGGALSARSSHRQIFPAERFVWSRPAVHGARP